MPKDFIKNKVGHNSLIKARKQQEQLSYFTQSKVQEEISQSWFDSWAQNDFKTSDSFQNWICLMFRERNVKRFIKHLRYPLPSTKLIKKKIKPELARVYFAEDSYFKYTIRGEETGPPEELESIKFDEILFNKLFFNFNDILVHDLSGINTANRYFVRIQDVVAIRSSNSVIHEIAFQTVVINDEGKQVKGFIYINSKFYAFLDEELELEAVLFPHDLEVTPAYYLTKESFNDHEDIVRGSMFSEIRGDMEEYVLLKTLQKMTEPNGSIPVVTRLRTRDIKNNDDKQPEVDNNSGSSAMAATALTKINKPIRDEFNSVLEIGQEIEVPVVHNPDGSINMDIVEKFLHFNYLPVDAMDYVNRRIKEIATDITVTMVGDAFEDNNQAKNADQIEKSLNSKQDRLRDISSELTRIRKLSDWTFLALQHGPDNVIVDLFYGSDFFIESQTHVYDLVQKSPNPIESRSLLVKLAKSRTRFNQERAEREMILYKLLPYAVDTDFTKAIASQMVDSVNFQYQTRFNYWVSLFESQFGDILEFWNMLENSTESERFVLINNLIIKIIKENERKIKPKNDQGAGGTS